MKTMTKKKPTPQPKVEVTRPEQIRKTFYVSNTLGAEIPDGSQRFPFPSIAAAKQGLFAARGRRTVRIRGGDKFTGGFGLLHDCGEGAKDRITFEPWGDGSPHFTLKRREPLFDAAQELRVTVRGMTFHFIEPWYACTR